MKDINYNDENWKLFEDLLAPSWDGDYTSIIDVIVNFLDDNTNAKIELQKVDNKKYNIIAKFGNPTFMLNCHMDTVPVAGKWNTNPFELIHNEYEGKFYGLGTCDTKGNLWAILEAVKEESPSNLMLAFTVDEEKGTSSGMENLIDENKLESIKEAIIFEPTNCEFITKHKGYYSFIISAKTQGGHSSEKQNKYENAIIVCSNISTKLFNLGFNIGKINGGKAGNIVADECEIKVSIRTYKQIEDIKKELNNSIQNEIENCNIKIELKYVGIPFFNNILNLNNESILNKALNKNEQEVDFWTESALVQNSGINSVVYGSGSIKQAHKENEFVKIAELIKCKEQIKNIIKMINNK